MSKSVPSLEFTDQVTVRFDDSEIVNKGLRALGIASSGAGKSHMCSRILEQCVEQDMQFVVLDPEGEYRSIMELNTRDTNPILLVGPGSGLIPVKEGIPLYVEEIKKGRSMIFDLSGFTNVEFGDFVYALLDQLYAMKSKHRSPMLLVIDELDLFLPQRGTAAYTSSDDISLRLNKWNTIAKRGRKRGINTLCFTQRAQDVDKAAISQSWLLMIGKLNYEVDFKPVSKLVRPITFDQVRMMRVGDFIVVGLGEEPIISHVPANRLTTDLASTPEWDMEITYQAAGIDQSEISDLAEKLQALVKKDKKEHDEMDEMRSRLKRMEKRNAELHESLKIREAVRAELRSSGVVIEGDPSVLDRDTSVSDAEIFVRFIKESGNTEFVTKQVQQYLGGTLTTVDVPELQKHNEYLKSELKRYRILDDVFQSLRSSFFAILGTTEGELGNVSMPVSGISESEVISLIKKHVPAGGSAVVVTEEVALGKIYQESAFKSIASAIEKLDDEQLKILGFLMHIGKGVTIEEVIKGVYHKDSKSGLGRGSPQFDKRMADLRKLMLTAAPGGRIRDNIEELVKERLGAVGASDSEIADVISKIKGLIASKINNQ